MVPAHRHGDCPDALPPGVGAWCAHHSGGYITTPSAGRYLHHNGLLPAPLKFVRNRQGDVQCRVDVPQPASDTDDGRPSNLSEGWEPLNFQVVRAITQLVDGCESFAGNVFDPEQVVDHLTQSGRSASRDGDRVLIHFCLPGAFGQIRYEHDPRVGPRLAADLLTLSGRRSLPPRRGAAGGRGQLAFAAGAFRADRDAPLGIVLRSLFWNALIPSAWLMVALETIEAAMSLTLRELQALRDPTLARLLVAVSTA